MRACSWRWIPCFLILTLGLPRRRHPPSSSITSSNQTCEKEISFVSKLLSHVRTSVQSQALSIVPGSQCNGRNLVTRQDFSILSCPTQHVRTSGRHHVRLSGAVSSPQQCVRTSGSWQALHIRPFSIMLGSYHTSSSTRTSESLHILNIGGISVCFDSCYILKTMSGLWCHVRPKYNDRTSTLCGTLATRQAI